MDGFLKTAAGALVALVLYLTVAKQSKDIATIIGILSCVLIATAAMHYLQPIISFFSRLRSIGKFDPECMLILVRCVGIGLLAEIISLICTDAGNAAMGKTLQLMAGTVILWHSLPLFTKLIELVEEVLLLV